MLSGLFSAFFELPLIMKIIYPLFLVGSVISFKYGFKYPKRDLLIGLGIFLLVLFILFTLILVRNLFV